MDSHQFDNENYWNRSTSKAFSFDDDETPGTSDSNDIPKWNNVEILDEGDLSSETSFENDDEDGTLNMTIGDVLSETDLSTLLDEQILDDRIVTKGVTPEEELRLLRRQVQTTLYNPSPETTAYKLLLGKNVSFEVYKSLNEKEQLLDAVIAIGGGDGIIGVLLFLRETLNITNFHKILQQRPKALIHYLSYLNQQKSNEALEILQLFGHHQEAALMQFQTALSHKNLSTRIQKVRTLSERYTVDGNVVPLYQQIFNTSLKLLEFIEKEQNAFDNQVDMNSTPIEILYACCRKHTNWKDHDFTSALSPFKLSAELQISPALFEWTALHERATAQAYGDLESVFERASTWHPMKQKQFHISFSLETAIMRLYELNAPTAVLYLFLSKINNSNEKLELAKRVGCVKGVIDALIGLKDINEIQKLRDSLSDRSEERYYCDNALKILQTKRWSTDNIKLKL